MFHVPEKFRMRNDSHLSSSARYGHNGLFQIGLHKPERILLCIASDGIEWRPVEGFEYLYEVSNAGVVRALFRIVQIPNGAQRVQEKHIVSLEKTERGYTRASLCNNAEIKKVLVHILVARAFIENPNNYPEINHKDGNKLNNCASNLEWCTTEYNHHHAIENGLRDGLKKIEIENIKNLLLSGKRAEDVAELYDLHRSSVYDIKFGRHRNLNPELPSGYKGVPLWEHVSVSVFDGLQSTKQKRCPTWEEMCTVKGLFWDEEDCVIEYHPAKSEYVSCHPFCLHLWRPVNQTFPTPPSDLVGPRSFIKS